MNLRLAGFSVMLLMTMAMSTISLFALAVVASELEAEFGLSKFELGLLGAANTGVGGLFAPRAGRLSDRLGGRRSIGVVLAGSGLSTALMAAAPSYGWLLAANIVAGIPQGWGNPATNKAISRGVSASQRGTLTGIKQSGVQLAVFLAGVVMPPVTAAAGWRTGLWVAAGLSVVAVFGLRFVPELDDEQLGEASDTTPTDADPDRSPLRPFVYQIAIYGFLLGFVGGGLGRFLPLFAEEAVAFTAAGAGLVFGLQGLVAIPTRISTGMALDRGLSVRTTLTTMGLVGGVAVLLILSAASVGQWMMWVGTVLAGLTLGAWNTAANLSMIREGASAGRASGMLMFGFLLGLTVGGPTIGWSIDAFGYTPGWIASAVMAWLGATVVARRIDGPGTSARNH